MVIGLVCISRFPPSSPSSPPPPSLPQFIEKICEDLKGKIPKEGVRAITLVKVCRVPLRARRSREESCGWGTAFPALPCTRHF